jgi:ribosomal protein L13
MAPSTRTYVAKPTDRERNWLVVDANGKTLGRLATQVADVLRGKRKPEYTPHVDTGDFVVVVNAEKIHVTATSATTATRATLAACARARSRSCRHGARRRSSGWPSKA